MDKRNLVGEGRLRKAGSAEFTPATHLPGARLASGPRSERCGGENQSVHEKPLKNWFGAGSQPIAQPVLLSFAVRATDITRAASGIRDRTRKWLRHSGF